MTECSICGAAVVNQERHTEFHRAILIAIGGPEAFIAADGIPSRIRYTEVTA